MRQQAINLQQVLGKKRPDPEQMLLFDGAPAKRGFSWSQGITGRQKESLFEAVLLLALAQADKGPVYIFVPRELLPWATDQIRRVASEMFARCKKTKQALLAERLGPLYKALLIGHNRLKRPPPRWVVFGFDDSDDLPKWLLKAQIPVYAFLRDDDDT